MGLCRYEYYGEYGNIGLGVNLIGWVSWMVKLIEVEVVNFLSLSFIDGLLWFFL